MTRVPIMLIVLALLSACNYRILTNGQFSHKADGLAAKGTSLCDSCLVFEPFETLPDSAILVSQTTILSPFFWMKRAPFECPMIDRAKAEAQKTGANVIWIYNKQGIYNQEGSIFKRLKFETRLYLLQEPYKSAFARRQDSLKKVRADLCVVHIKSHTVYDCPIYWNDALVGHCDGFLWYHGQVQSCDFVFPAGGVLSCQDKRKKLNLEKGKEYYLVIQSIKGGYWFFETDKHRW